MPGLRSSAARRFCALARKRRMAVTDNFTSRAGWPCRSNSRPWITCSGRSVMSAVGWSASGSSVDPAGAITRRQGDRAEFIMTRRRGARDIDLESARAVARGPAELFRVEALERSAGRPIGGPWTARRPSRTRSAPACLVGRARGQSRTSGRGRALGSDVIRLRGDLT